LMVSSASGRISGSVARGPRRTSPGAYG
jgi:hypothetical protein